MTTENTLASATYVSFGEVVDGTIEDDFDFDYFGFEAVEGRTYRRTHVTSGTLEWFRNLGCTGMMGLRPQTGTSNQYDDDTAFRESPVNH